MKHLPTNKNVSILATGIKNFFSGPIDQNSAYLKNMFLLLLPKFRFLSKIY